MEVGDGIDLADGTWSFDQAASRFDVHIGRSIPNLDQQRDFVARLSRFFLHPGSLAYELGVSTGRLAEQVLARVAGRDLRYVGLDDAPAMIAQARHNLASDARFEGMVADVTGCDFEPAALMISFYTLQFVPAPRRAALLARIRDAITPGGALILFEKTLASHPRIQDLLGQVYAEYKLEQGFTADEILNKARSLQGILDPGSSAWNLALLRQCGFGAVETIYRNYCFEGYLAIKDPT
jgi:tRNA (cmo5U34)-methyltransferase